MDKNLELIKKLKDELEKLKNSFETAYINNTNNINEINEVEKEIKAREEIVNKKENSQGVILLKNSAIFLTFLIIIGIVAPTAVVEILGKTILISMMIGMLLTVIPRTSKILYNFILKLSPKLKNIEDEINILKKEISRLKEKKEALEERKNELTNILNKAELSMKEKETELREKENIYFKNMFNSEQKEIQNTTQQKQTVKVRKKVKESKESQISNL